MNDSLKDQVKAVREFNRFYTRQIGALDEGLLASPFTLTQARVLFELGTRDAVTAVEIGEVLGLDAGYLSRIIRDFESQGLLLRTPSREDGRRVSLVLTAQGKKALRVLDKDSREVTTGLLSRLSAPRRQRLVNSMKEVRHALSANGAAAEVVIRTHRIGDIGWAIERHGQLYADEFGWNAEFEALVATLFAQFATTYDPESERCWIAEVDGERAGCVFVIRNPQEPTTAQLRCLLVDPLARGLGVGRRLVEECIRFAEAAGYARMLLWTNDVLASARSVYQATGFLLASEESHHSFGHDLVGQVWTRDL